MIRDAIRTHAPFANCSLTVYGKGSYPNNTNVRADSDVDIAVQCHDVMYWEESTPGAKATGSSPYQGPWTPAKLRAELKAALTAKFPSQVDSSGSTAFRIHSGSARVDADVVPCFDYRYYMSGGSYRDGARVIKADGAKINNYPEQQLRNGIEKNKRTSLYYKQAVRIMKRLENAMVGVGVHREVPSFFIECLVYNVPDGILLRSSWTDTIKGVISHIFHELDGPEPGDATDRWLEVNECKYLFHSSQEWTRQDARAFAKAGWNYLGLGA